MPSRIIDDGQLPLEDITEELHLCFSDPSRLSSFIYCDSDEFSFSESYQVILVTTKNQLCLEPEMRVPDLVLPPPRVDNHSGVFFVLSLNRPDAIYCGVRVAIQFENDERFSGGFVIEGGPRPVEIYRYEMILTPPGNGRPIAGMVYDSQTTDIFYVVTKMKY